MAAKKTAVTVDRDGKVISEEPPRADLAYSAEKVAKEKPVSLIEPVVPEPVLRKGKYLSDLMKQPHPAVEKQPFLNIHGFHLKNPALLQYPAEVTTQNDLLKITPLQHALRSIKEKSYSPYLGSYTSVYNVCSHLINSTGNTYDTTIDVILDAIHHCLCFIKAESGPAFNSHLKFWVDCTVLPDLYQVLLIKRMMTATKNFASTQQLHKRLYLPPAIMMKLFDPVCGVSMHDVDFEQYFVLLSLCTGHHAGESFMFNLSSDIRSESAEVLVHAFKFNTNGNWKPCNQMLLMLCGAAMNSKLKVLDKNIDPADAFAATNLYSSENALATAVNNWLAKNVILPTDFMKQYSEKLTHRILRRTFASILHVLEWPFKAICYILNHASELAVKNYVVQMSTEDIEFVQNNKEFFMLFVPKCNMACSDKTLELLTKPIQPKIFAMPKSDKANDVVADAYRSKRLKTSDDTKPIMSGDPSQLSILGFLHRQPVKDDDVESVLTDCPWEDERNPTHDHSIA